MADTPLLLTDPRLDSSLLHAVCSPALILTKPRICIGNARCSYVVIRRPSPRLWCSDCGRVAADECLREHSLHSLRKARAERASLRLAGLADGEAALRALRDHLDGAHTHKTTYLTTLTAPPRKNATRAGSSAGRDS